MSTPEFARKVFNLVAESPEVKRKTLNFEMAYQSRVAAERIRFAIRSIEALSDTGQLRDAVLRLVDALDRLESAERHFQKASERVA